MGLINTSTVKPTLMDLQVPTEKSSMESTLNSPIPNDFDQQQQQEEGDEDKLSQSKAETLNNNNNNPIWVDWSENDSENPFNFSNAKKWKITIITCSFTVLVAISGTSFPSGEPSMERAFGNEQELSIVAYIMAPLLVISSIIIVKETRKADLLFVSLQRIWINTVIHVTFIRSIWSLLDLCSHLYRLDFVATSASFRKIDSYNYYFPFSFWLFRF